ncbi:MAG: sensor histidine kinase [Gemmiger sp.]|nr:sensor histidine kinase [Gemmiger sp.]
MTMVLVLIVMSIVALMLVVCVTVFSHQYESATVQNAKTSSGQAVAQVVNTVQSYTEDMNEVMALLTGAMQDATADPGDFMSAFLQMRPDVIAVTAYDAAGTLQSCWAEGRQPKADILRNLSFDGAAAGTAANHYISAPHVETIFDGYYPWVVTMAARLPGGGGAAWVALDLSFTGISSYISNVGIGQHGYCFLMDANGTIIYHPQQQLIYSGLKSEDTARLATLQDGTYTDASVIYCLQGVPGSNWRVVGVSYLDELVTGNVLAMVRILLLLAALLLAVALLVSWIVSSVLSSPLHRLSTAMAEFEQDAGRFSYQPVKGAREVRNLSDSFGHMVLRIQRLMATVREEEVNLRKTELKALQAQINPHFLYNTLDSIAWMCERGRNADAVQMVHALARLFRISISKGHELIPIRKELEHAESYLQIQKYRYKNQFEYTFTVDPACLDYLCNKITLQPIIENAICHGLELMVEEGHIAVKVEEAGQDILLSVTDNGVGMTAEQVDAMLKREPSDRTGIGIKNVNDRLRIYFGEPYGLHITSEPDVGTCVEIRMPKVREGEYENK